MINCLAKHFEKVQILKITNNRIGALGAKKLAEVLKDMKAL
mgnify:CR=1 FL=1